MIGTNCLFVGGPFDGEMRYVDNRLLNRGYYEVARRAGPPEPIYAMDRKPPRECVFELVVYQLMKTQGKIPVFAYQKMSMGEVMDRLVQCYHPQGHGRQVAKQYPRCQVAGCEATAVCGDRCLYHFEKAVLAKPEPEADTPVTS